jgi:hypothetical protein
MFIADEDKVYEITVRLTEEGKRKYINQVHMRPPRHIDATGKSSNGDDVYVFRCTLHQADVYFFKFGAAAEILSPSLLKEKFAQDYADAAALY